jgi:hypothetical protein
MFLVPYIPNTIQRTLLYIKINFLIKIMIVILLGGVGKCREVLGCRVVGNALSQVRIKKKGHVGGPFREVSKRSMLGGFSDGLLQ